MQVFEGLRRIFLVAGAISVVACNSVLTAPMDQTSQAEEEPSHSPEPTVQSRKVEFYDRFGNVTWRLDTAASVVPIARAVVNSPKADEMRAVLRAARDSARKYEKRHVGSMDIQLKVLDALASTTGAAFHNRIAALPITQVRKETANATEGSKSVQIDFVWRGRRVAKMTYDERVKNTPTTNEQVSVSPSAQQDGDEEQYPCYENCGGGGGDGPSGDENATSQDIADAVAAVALMDAEVEALLQTVDMTEYGMSAPATSGTTSLEKYVNAPASGFALMPRSSGYPTAMSGCAGERGLVAVAVTAFSNSWWRVAIAAVALDPEPISKVTLGFALAAAAATYVAVGYAVNNLESCQHP